jgi:hypothetical protein
MPQEVTLTTICKSSEAVVARDIEGDIIIVPLVAGIGNDDDELYTLNGTGKAIWQKLDGRRTVADVVDALAQEFAPRARIEEDVLGFCAEMTKLGILSSDA